MYDGMPYDPIQGQGHGASEVLKNCTFPIQSPQLANDRRFLD